MKFFVSHLFLSLSVVLSAQSRAFDSLQTILKTAKDDTTKVNLLYQLSDHCKYDKGILLYAQQSLQLAEKLKFIDGVTRAAEILGEVYNQTGKYQRSLEMFELFKLMADSINNTETQKAAVKKQMQYDFDKKETETKAEQDKKDVIVFENLKKQRLNRNYFIGGSGLVLLFAIFMFRSYRRKHKANLIITSKKLEAEKQKNIIEKKQKEILDSIHYAKRIQDALLPTETSMEKNLNRLMRK